MNLAFVISFLSIAAFALAMNTRGYLGILRNQGWGPIEVAAGIIFPLALGLWLQRALEKRTIEPFTLLTFFCGCILSAGRVFHVPETLPFVYAVVWCCTAMFLVQTTAAFVRELRAIAA